MVNYKSFYVASVFFFLFKCFKNIKCGQNALIRLHFFPEFIIVKKNSVLYQIAFSNIKDEEKMTFFAGP